MGWGCWGGSPEERVVVGKEGEEDAEEEGCCCFGGAGRWGGGVSDLVWGVRRRGGGGGLVRQRIMKVAKDWERFPIAMAGEGIVFFFSSVERDYIKRFLPRRELASPASKSYRPVVRRSIIRSTSIGVGSTNYLSLNRGEELSKCGSSG